MKVHLVTNLFAPDQLAGAALFSDLACFLSEGGHDVRVTGTFSYYPDWELRSEDRRVAVRDEVWNGIKVRRVKMYVPGRPSGASRMLSDLSFFISLLLRARFRGWIPDVVVTACPMLSQCLVQRFMYFGKHVPRLIIVQDFVVDAALELGILRLPGIIGALRFVERWGLRSAGTLTTISESMRDKLTRVAGTDRRVLFIPNWIHKSISDLIGELRGERLDREDNLLVYSGNLGLKQGLPDFLKLWPSDTRWTLQINGGGAAIHEIQRVADRLPGVRLGGVQPELDYLRSLAKCSACLVTQRPGVGANFLPSKLLPALATGTPVLAVCGRCSPLGREVIEGGFGAVVEPGDKESLRSVLDCWGSDLSLLPELGRKALDRSRLYTRETVLKQLEIEMFQLTPASRTLVEHGAAS